MNYLGEPTFRHDSMPSTGVLILNLGTPDAPTTSAVRTYLAEFLTDPRVVETPRWLWRLILHGFILRFRPARAAHAYQKIWTENGSPLLVFSLAQREALKQRLSETVFHDRFGETHIELGMRYGNPSITSALRKLKSAGVERLLVLPLYPQYSATTTASTFDAISRELQHWRRLPELRFIGHYHDFPPYIAAMAGHIQTYWRQNGRADVLVFSFHGLPQRYLRNGDPYFCECHKTGRLLADALGLNEGEWRLAFQSRFGREPWLQPYTDHLLKNLPAQAIKSVDIFCPGFSADCLETLEEIAMQNREIFIEAGGKGYNYIPALNAEEAHIDALMRLIEQNLQGWEQQVLQDAKRAGSMERAVKQGAKQ